MTTSTSVFAERGVMVPREVLMMTLFKHYAASFDGWKQLALKVGSRVNIGKMSSERRVLALLQSMTDDELALEFSNLVRPTPSYLEAAGICEEMAMEIHAGESNDEALAYLSRQGILPVQFRLMADQWFKRRRSA